MINIQCKFLNVLFKLTYTPSKIKHKISKNIGNQPIRLPGMKPGVCSGLILSGAFYPDLKIGVWRRRTYQIETGPIFSYNDIQGKSP
jgi:hypothetical protein